MASAYQDAAADIVREAVLNCFVPDPSLGKPNLAAEVESAFYRAEAGGQFSEWALQQIRANLEYLGYQFWVPES